MADIKTLRRALSCTYPIRKGPKHTSRTSGNTEVVEVYEMPNREEFFEGFDTGRNVSEKDFHFADLFFLEVAVHKVEASALESKFKDWLETYPNPRHFKEGASYIEVGAHIGSQEWAFQLFAMGEALDLWQIMTPASLPGIPRDLQLEMAHKGMVGAVGYNPEGD